MIWGIKWDSSGYSNILLDAFLVSVHSSTRERWLEAQKEEVDYWQNIKSLPGKDWWVDTLARCFNIDFHNYFKDKDVFEIGAGPHGIIYSIEGARSKAAIEPMVMDGLETWKREIVKQGIGEKLEFPGGSFDIVICVNVLDHCQDPQQVVKEAARVLRKGGVLLLWVHCLQSRYSFLSGPIAAIDRTHPFHFKRQDIIRLIDSHFRIDHEHIVRGVGVKGRIPEGANMKTRVAHYLTENVFLVLKKD